MEFINAILAHLISWIEHVITLMGPAGVALLMAIDLQATTCGLLLRKMFAR